MKWMRHLFIAAVIIASLALISSLSCAHKAPSASPKKASPQTAQPAAASPKPTSATTVPKPAAMLTEKPASLPAPTSTSQAVPQATPALAEKPSEQPVAALSSQPVKATAAPPPAVQAIQLEAQPLDTQLVIEKSVIDLGDIIRGEMAKATFILHNNGKDIVQILSAKPG